MAGTASRNLRATAATLRRLPATTMPTAADTAERIAAAEGARAGGPMRGKKRRAMPLRAITTVRATATGATCRVQGVSVAGWVWRTRGTRPHRIRRAKSGPESRMYVQHPGSRGVGAWRAVQTRAAAAVPQLFRDAVHQAVR